MAYRSLLLASAVVIAVFAFIHLIQNKRGGLLCDGNLYDFGEIRVSNAAKLTHSFILMNKDVVDIHILSKSATCGCTRTDLSSTSVHPGESIILTAAADWSNKSGQQHVQIAVKTDSSKTPVVLCDLAGVIHVPISAQPATLNFGDLNPGETDSRTVRISGRHADLAGVVVTRVVSTSHNLEIVPDGRVQSADSTLAFIVNIKAPAMGGDENGQIQFFTSSNEIPLIIVPIDAHYNPAIEASPSALFFAKKVVNPSDGVQKIRVACISDAFQGDHSEPQIALVEKDDAPFDFSIGSHTQSDKYDIFYVNIKQIASKSHIQKVQFHLRIIKGAYAVDVPLHAYP